MQTLFAWHRDRANDFDAKRRKSGKFRSKPWIWFTPKTRPTFASEMKETASLALEVEFATRRLLGLRGVNFFAAAAATTRKSSNTSRDANVDSFGAAK